MATIGLDKLYYAPITENANGEETYGTPVQLAKAISADLHRLCLAVKALAHTFEQGFFFCPQIKKNARFVGCGFHHTAFPVGEHDFSHARGVNEAHTLDITADVAVIHREQHPPAAVGKVEADAVFRYGLAEAVVQNSGIA